MVITIIMFLMMILDSYYLPLRNRKHYVSIYILFKFLNVEHGNAISHRMSNVIMWLFY